MTKRKCLSRVYYPHEKATLLTSQPILLGCIPYASASDRILLERYVYICSHHFIFELVNSKINLLNFTENNRVRKMSKGTVKWFNADKGFGFITPEDGGKDLFVHHSEIQSGGGYATLNDGQEVEYEVGQGQKGPCANKVIPL